MDTINEKRHERLYEWFRDSGMTGQEMGDCLGYTQAAISYFVNGRRPLTDSFYFRFLRKYGRHTFNALFPELAIK